VSDPTRRPSSDGYDVPELHLEREPDHLAARRRDDRIALGATLALALVAVMALVAVNLAGSTPGVDDQAAEERGVELDADPPAPPPAIGALAPHDGLDSLRHPLRVHPSVDLLDGQAVTVSGSEFPPDRDLGVVMCSGAVDLGGGAAQCQLAPFTPVRSRDDGTFEVEHVMRRIIWVGGHEIDCASPIPDGLEATCVVAVGAISDYDESGIAPVRFDDSVPAPPAPSLRVSPTAGLVDGQVVTVELLDLDISAEHWWWPDLCVSAPELFAPHPDAEHHGDTWCESLADEQGGYELIGSPSGTSVDVTVHRLLAVGTGAEPLDCAAWPGRCWIQVWAGHRPIDPVPLTFDPEAPTTERDDPLPAGHDGQQ
jgi:hypothetical protein